MHPLKVGGALSEMPRLENREYAALRLLFRHILMEPIHPCIAQDQSVEDRVPYKMP